MSPPSQSWSGVNKVVVSPTSLVPSAESSEATIEVGRSQQLPSIFHVR